MHARHAPSSLARTIQCHGWQTVAHGLPPEEETDHTKEGDAAHWLALEYTEGREHCIGTRAPNGWEVDMEMVVSAKLWRDTVGPVGIPEMPVTIGRIHDDCWGTPDRHQFTPNVLRVWDYKYGHKHVDPWENWQLIAYAIGLIDLYASMGYREDEMRVDLCVVQPRAYRSAGPVKYWRRKDGALMLASDLRGFANRAYMAVEEAEKPNPPTRVGPECKYCPARHVCKTLQYAATDVVQYAGGSTPVKMSSSAIGVELTILTEAKRLLEARMTGLQVQADQAARAGMAVTGWYLKPTMSKLKWTVPVDEIVKFGDARAIDLRKPQECITPTQARDRKLLSEDDLAKISDRGLGGSVLEQSSGEELRKIFGVL